MPTGPGWSNALVLRGIETPRGCNSPSKRINWLLGLSDSKRAELMTDWMVELRQSSADSLPAIAQWL
ncbi:MAG TPA: hypothetical protein DCQ06_04720, partial [Myxococcales bacterium]|nr:hypothetical protein [Myxococcales bacterium]